MTDLVNPVREVIDAGIFVEEGGRLAFQHDLAREAVRSAVPDTVRRALDREAADVLLAGGALPVEVAARLAASAEPGDVTAVRALAEAADSLGMTDPSASADIASVALSLVPSRHPLRGRWWPAGRCPCLRRAVARRRGPSPTTPSARACPLNRKPTYG